LKISRVFTQPSVFRLSSFIILRKTEMPYFHSGIFE